MTSDRLINMTGLRMVGCTVAAVVASFAAISTGDMAHGDTASAGTVVGWGDNRWGQALRPAGLTGISAVAAGGFHTLGLMADSTVVAWGNDGYGQASGAADLTGVTQVAAGGFHRLALRSDGTVVAWGDDRYGQLSVPADLTGVTQVAAGTRHSLALVVDRSVVSFGNPSTTAENAGVAQLVVSRTNVTDTEATVSYAPTGGTATPGVDFTLDPGVVTFAVGQTSATISVPITNDTRPEAAETITVTLGDPGARRSGHRPP